MNSFKDLMLTRQACRSYNGKPVEKEKLEALADAVRLSPSACNSQPWRLIVVGGEKARLVKDSVQKEGRNGFTEDCPAFAIIVEEKAKLLPAIADKMPSQTFAQMDIGIATAHYVLMASDLGLSTCIIGWMNEEKLKKDFNIGNGEEIRLVIATGYANEDDKIRPKKRRELNEIAEFIE